MVAPILIQTILYFSIVRAVSAPSEGTALTGQNNRESNAFCHFDETEQNAGGPPLHRPYNVDVNGTSECANQKIRTSSFFYEYFLNQFQKSNNSYSISKKNFSSGKEKRYPPYIDFVFRKRNLLGIEIKSQVKINNSKRSLSFMKIQKQGENLNSSEKKGKKITKLNKVKDKRSKRDLKNVEINDELDINKRIEKLVKQIALENLRTQESDSVTEFAEPSKEFRNHEKGLATETRDSSPFFRRIFRFDKNYSNKNVTNDDKKVGSVRVKIVQDKEPTSVVKARNGSDDVLESLRKTTRSRRNSHKSFSTSFGHFDNTMPRFKDKLNMQFDALNDDANNVNNFLFFPKSKKFMPGGRRQKRRNGKIRSRRKNDFDRYPSNYRKKYGAFDSWLKRNDASDKHFKKTKMINPVIIQLKGKSMAKSNRPIFFRKNQAGISFGNSEESNRQKIGKMNDFDIQIKLKVPPHTLERPLLQQPISNYTQRKATLFKYELPNDEYLSPYRYLKIRHALRNYLIHNEVWSPVRKDFLNEKRTKRREGSFSKRCSKSAPLLCIPYIKKGQDEMLRQIIRSVQQMMEKPVPQKVEIFEKTKFKPCIKKDLDHRRENKPCDEPQEPKTTPSSKCHSPPNHKHRLCPTHSPPTKCSCLPKCSPARKSSPVKTCSGPKTSPASKICRRPKTSPAPKICAGPKNTPRKSSSPKFCPLNRKLPSTTACPCPDSCMQCPTCAPCSTQSSRRSQKCSKGSTRQPCTTQCSTRTPNMSQCPICLPCPAQYPSPYESTTFATHCSDSTTFSFISCPTTPSLGLSMPPPTPGPAKATTSYLTTTTTLPTMNRTTYSSTTCSSTTYSSTTYSSTTYSSTTYSSISPTSMGSPTFSTTPCFSIPPTNICQPTFSPTPYFSNPPVNICSSTFSSALGFTNPSPITTIPTPTSHLTRSPLTMPSMAPSPTNAMFPNPIKLHTTTCLALDISPIQPCSMVFSTLSPINLSHDKSSSTSFTESSLTTSSLGLTTLPFTLGPNFAATTTSCASSLWPLASRAASDVFLTTSSDPKPELFSTNSPIVNCRLPNLSKLTTTSSFNDFQPFSATASDLSFTKNCLDAGVPTLATIPFINTSSPITTPPICSSTSQALRNFLQTLSPVSRPNLFPSSGNSCEQGSQYSNLNIDQLTTPTTYFSPTSYFLNEMETPAPCSAMKSCSANFPRNFGGNFFPNQSENFSSKPSSENYCSLCFSNHPTQPKDYFATPPSGDSPDKLSQESKLPRAGSQQSSALPLGVLNMKNNNPDWTLTFAHLTSTESLEFAPSEKQKSKSTQYEKSFEDASENNENNSKVKGGKKFAPSENLKTDKITNRNFLSNKLMKYRQDNENIYKKVSKPRRHRINSKYHRKSDRESPTYDLYERSPFARSTEKSFRYQKYPFPWLFHQRRIKKHAKRQKREDHYHSSIEDSNYHKQNANYGLLYPKHFQLVRSRDSRAEEPNSSSEKDPETTPFFFALFSELAKVIARPEDATEMNENDVSQENSSKAPEKRKSEPFTLQNDTDSNATTSLAEKALLQSLNSTFMDEIELGNTTGIADNLFSSSTTQKFKGSGIKKKTTTEEEFTTEDLPIPTTPLIPKPTKSPSFKSESTTCYCGPTTTTDKNEKILIKPCRPKTLTPSDITTECISSNSEKKEIEEEINPITDATDEGRMPSTLKFASIVKGPKKVLVKPSPKTYTKVFPDSLANELEANETKSSVSTLDVVRKMPMHIFPISNNRLQLLAVCEGYLEVIRLIKAQNQSVEGGVDADLTRYCESIISQSFAFASDNDVMKLKKIKLFPTPPAFSETLQSPKKHRSTNPLKAKLFTKLPKDLTTRELRDKIVVDILSSPVYKRELAAKIDLNRKKKFKNNSYSQVNLKYKVKKYKSYRPASDCTTENLRRFRRKDKTEDELLSKGIPKEQMKLLHLLRKRKRALLSWLFNSKEDQIKPDDMRETEYLDDEEYVTPNPDLKEATGKITPKVDETTSKTTTNETTFVQSTIFPVYAKNYGYDKGGELREVDVLWRKVNEKTHEKKIFRNQSVLALLLAPPSPLNAKREGTRPGNDNEDMSETRSRDQNRVSYAEPSVLSGKLNSTASTKMVTDNSSFYNNTQTIISKPDASSIVGTPPNVTTANPNTAHKLSHALATAKELFQEYIIEFLNYAVYILPIMFTLLFLFCCMCCFLQVLRNKKNRKKKKKRRKKKGSSDDESDDGGSSDTESEFKKKIKRKKPDKKKTLTENLEKKPSRTIWSVLRLNSAKPSSEFNDDNSQAEKRSFLWFLRSKKDEGKIEEPYTTLHELDENSVSYKSGGGQKNKEINDSDDQTGSMLQNEGRKKRKEQKNKLDEQIEANERRELIALLEELKKIEMEKAEEKKEHRSVYVQYMTQEEDNSFSMKQESRPKQLGKPRGHSFCQKHFSFDEGPAFQNYEFYEDVGELTELLPCERNNSSKRSDYFKHPDFRINQGERCERFFKIIRDSGVTQNKHFREMDFMKSGDRSYIFNKYRTISTGTRDELLGGTDKNSETEITDTVLPFSLPPEKKIDLIEEMENLKRQLNKKKYVRLKDNGVLCRL